MFQRFFKKAIDFLTALIGLIVLIPFFSVIAVLIKLDSKGPVFFRQERTGKNGKTFFIWKFRTMIKGADEAEVNHSLSEKDLRITRIGRFLRRWTFDEWPQLINILKKEMSLVGPRPLPVYQMQTMNEFQKRRLKVLPGMVSLVDVRGRNLVPWEERFNLDNWYIDNWSLQLDFKILLLTPFIIFSRKGIYGEDGINNPPQQ